jgi:hypothetical protein
MLKRFAIYSPVLGQRQDIPNILLNKAFTTDNTNVQIWDNEIRKIKLRTKELIRDIYPISSVDTSSDTISISGNYVSRFPSGATVTVYDTDDNYAQFTLSTTATYSTTSTVLTVTGDITAATPSDFVFNDANVASRDPANVNFLKVGFPDGNPALRYERFVLSDSTERLVAFTKANVYYWDTALTQWTSLFASSGTCTYWDAVQYGDYLCATNNVDRPIKWDGGAGTTFQNIDTNYSTTANYIAKAKFIGSWQNYLILGNVELSDGTRQQHHIYTSNIGEGVATNGWRQDTAKDASYYRISGDGEIEGGFGYWHDFLIVFKSRSIAKLWFVGGAIPLAQSAMLNSVGSSAPGAVGNDWNGNLYYYGSDASVREIQAGVISEAVNSTVRDINPAQLAKLRFQAMDEYQELRWAIPYGSTATENNKIIVFDSKRGKWANDIDIAVTAFGEYTRQTNYTWDTLPFDTWDAWAWESWDAVEEAAGFPIEICGDADGYTYLMHGGYADNGSAYDSYFVLSTDMADKGALPHYKRISQIYVYVRAESTGTLALSAKRDNETSWQSLGSVSLEGDEDILRQRLAVDVRARHLLIKGLSQNAFSFIGIEFEYQHAGDR